MSEKSYRNWWAASTANARWTLLGGAALIAILAVVCGFIWLSPSDIVNNASQTAGRAIEKSHSAQLDQQNAALQKQIASLQAQLGAAKAQSFADDDHASQKAKQDAATVASLKRQLAGANAALSDAQSEAGRQGSLASAASASAESAYAKAARSAADAKKAKASLTAVKKVADKAQASVRTVAHKAATAAKPKPKPSGSASSAPASTPAAPAITAPSKAQILAADHRYFGVYTTQSPFNYAEVDDVETKVGGQFSAIGYFQGWDQPFRPDGVQAAWKHGQLPLMTWESRPIDDPNSVLNEPDYTLAKIIGGSFDAYLTQYAQQITATGLPLVIRLDQEMNGTWYPWSEDDGHGKPVNGNAKGQFTQMWQHVWNIFQANGANQYVIWDWSPNIVNNLTTSHQSFAYTQSLYPGDQYVDVVGLSGYQRSATDANVSFDNTFGSSLQQLRQLTGKPIVLSEIGATEGGGKKVQWENSLFQALAQPANRDIVGAWWFNETITSNGTTNDWRITSTDASTQAVKAGLANAADDFALQPL